LHLELQNNKGNSNKLNDDKNDNKSNNNNKSKNESSKAIMTALAYNLEDLAPLENH